MQGSYLKGRLLKLQVGFLLSEGPGSSREFPVVIPQRIQVENDLFLEALAGNLILTRTREGILIQGKLQVSHRRVCDRCMDDFIHAFEVVIAELFASPPDAIKSVFSVDSNGEIDLAPLLREEVLIDESYRAVCQTGCRGLSAATGLNLNDERESEAAVRPESDSGRIDPRMAVLKQLLK